MSDRKYATIFLDDGNCHAMVYLKTGVEHCDGITERNILELVKVVTDRGYHVTLYRIANPKFFSETDQKDVVT